MPTTKYWAQRDTKPPIRATITICAMSVRKTLITSLPFFFCLLLFRGPEGNGPPLNLVFFYNVPKN